MPPVRTRRVHFVMSEKEYDRMSRKIESLGIRNYSAYFRKMVLDGYCIRLDIPEIKKMTSLLGRCSNNLNQYARKANQTGSVYAEDIRDLQARFDEFWEIGKELLTRLSNIR